MARLFQDEEEFNGIDYASSGLPACDYDFDPEMNRIKKARFSSDGVLGLLSKYDIIID